MIFESLSDRLQETFKKLRGHGKLTEDDVNEAMREASETCEREMGKLPGGFPF